MDYEKKYREALERAKESMKDGGISQNTIDYLQNIFPEIADSEDERIRKELLSFVRGLLACHDKPNAERDEKYESWIAWLEKQGEQKPEWSEEDDKMLNNIIYSYQHGWAPHSGQIDWLKSLRPQKHWKPSEEMLEALYRAIPENTMAISEDEMLLDKLYQGLKYGRVLSNN